MDKRVSIHADTYRTALKIGREMAADPGIRPHLHNVGQYSCYYHFRLAHRAHLEQSQRFERHYQERIYALADQEARRCGSDRVDAALSWDAWYHTFVHPIKTIMWRVWEQQFNLEARFFNTLMTSGRAEDIARMTGNRDSDPDQLPETLRDRARISELPQRLSAALAGMLQGLRPRARAAGH